MPSSQPEEFRLSLTHPSGASVNIEWKPPGLEYRAYDEHFDPTRMERAEPTPEQWQAFWEATDRAGVWSWQPRYVNPTEEEGVQWQVALQAGERQVRSYGDSAFPSAGTSAAEPSPEFRQFLDALRQLIGVSRWSDREEGWTVVSGQWRVASCLLLVAAVGNPRPDCGLRAPRQPGACSL
jgi:hypothetical protein